ncbi:MAG TPA: DoxX family protein [Terriglobia bacterium]|nr:DoxX family protein [Terriglobia bacterium]
MKGRRSDKPSTTSQPGAEPVAPEPFASRWSLSTLIAFRFCVAYLGLFILVTQISGSMLPNLSFYYRGLGRLWPLRDLTEWIAVHVFGTAVETGTGGEPLFFWIQAFWVLMLAVIVTVVWSLLDRHRTNYDVLHRWFRLFVRFALAAAMFEYGMTKVIPTQFPAPSLETLVTPTGDLTLSALLWTSIGSSPAYQIFTGIIEVLGAILLLTPRTTMLGAIISLAAMIQVFVLNMTYDIGLKLISFHLILLALFLLAPEIPRLLDFFVRNRPVGVSAQPHLFNTPRANRIALGLQLAFGLYLVGMYLYINVSFWEIGGGGRPKSALYGIWNIESLEIDGQVRDPGLNDYDRRWKRLIFEEPARATFQRTDDSFARFGARIDSSAKTLALTKGGSKTWKANFLFERPSPEQLILQGEMDGHKIQARFRLVEFDTLRLLNSRFRWVRPQ